MKKIVLIILSAVLLLSAVSCTDLLKPQEKVFSSNGMSITLTTEFNEASIEGYTVCYECLCLTLIVFDGGGEICLFADVTAGADKLRIDHRVIKIKACAVRTMTDRIRFPCQPLRQLPIGITTGGKKAVHRLAIGVGHTRHIIGCLGSSLQLKGGDAWEVDCR